MLKFMRESFGKLKWVLLAVVVAFVFGFVFIDMGLGGASVGGSADAQGFAARVNGETITYSDYYRALKRYEDMYKQMYGGQFTPEMAAALRLPTQVMDALVDQRLMTQEAARMNLEATPEEVRKKLLDIPVFVQDGKFVGMELYNRYVTGPLGYTSAAEFEADLAREIELGKMESALTSSVVVSPKAADVEYRRINENAKIRFVLLPAGMQTNVTVTPAEVESYYRNNQQKYTHGEQRLVRYLLADLAKLRQQMAPGEAELRQRYESVKQQYTTPDAAKVLHILVKVDPGASPAIDGAARAKAQTLVSQLRAGADFGALAQANSEDPSSSGNGGDMGWVERGQTVEPFEQAIFSVPLNAISDPIRTTEYGYHIVKVTERRPAGVRPFEEVRGELAARMTTEKVQEAAQNEANRVAAIIRTKGPKTVDEFVANQNNVMTSNDTGWFSKNDAIPGIGNHPPFSEWVFSAKKGDVSPAIGTPRGPAIAYVVDVRPAGVSSINEIRAKVEEDARLAKAGTAAQSALAQMMAGATSIDQVAAKSGVAVREATVNRQGPVSGLSGDTSAIVEAAIASKVGEIKGPVTVKDGAVAFQIVEQKKVTASDIAQNRAAFIDNLRQQQARSLRSSLLKRLRQESKVEINEDLVRPAPPQQAGL